MKQLLIQLIIILINNTTNKNMTEKDAKNLSWHREHFNFIFFSALEYRPLVAKNVAFSLRSNDCF